MITWNFTHVLWGGALWGGISMPDISMHFSNIENKGDESCVHEKNFFRSDNNITVNIKQYCAILSIRFR